jgi:uncharacterized protein (TIGR03437 family)
VPFEDNGATCRVCHSTFELNPPGGRLTVEVQPYRPGVTQTIRVTVFHPEAQRWGFQMTARPVNDLTQMAGTFTANESIRVRCAPNGANAPCGDAVEYASHTVLSTTSGGANGSKTFDIEWTPPAAEVGRIAFFVSGNAANNNQSPSGDRIYNTRVEVALDPATPCGITQRPQISHVQDGAAFGSSIGQGALFTIKGANLTLSGIKRLVGPGDVTDNRFPSELGCVAVEVNNQRVPVMYAQQDQINAQMPAVTGPVQVRVIANPGRSNEMRSDVATATLQTVAPRFFTFNGTSIAARVGGTATPVAEGLDIPGSRAARPGEVIELYATGLGLIDPAIQPGEITPTDRMIQLPAGSLTVTVGGTTLSQEDVVFAGLAPGSISGLSQINIRVPATANGIVPVSMRLNGVESAAGTTIPVRP